MEQIPEHCPDIKSWDISRVTDMSGLFSNTIYREDQINNIEEFNPDISQWDTSSVTNMSHAFAGLSNFNGNLSNWDVSKVMSLDNAFRSCLNFNSDLSNWDVSKVTSLDNAFHTCSKFNSDLSNWNVSKVTNLDKTFAGCLDFNTDLSHWDTARVKSMRYTFETALNFAENVSQWNTARVTTLEGAFMHAENYNADILHWNVSKVTDLESTFSGAYRFNADVSHWDIAKVSNMASAFRDCTDFNQNLNTWNVAKVVDLTSTFGGASSFNGDIARWEVGRVIYMDRTFQECRAFNRNLNLWDVSLVTSLESTFQDSNFNGDIHAWNVARISSMEETFAGSALDQDLSAWTIGRIVQADEIFEGLANMSDCNAFNIRLSWSLQNNPRVLDVLSTFPVSRPLSCTCSLSDTTIGTYVKNLNSTHAGIGCEDISTWNVARVTSLHSVFKDLSTSFNANISMWNISSVSTLEQTFYGADAFNADISSWDVGNVETLSGTFAGAASVNTDIGAWTVDRVTDLDFTFTGATAFNRDLSLWNISKVTSMAQTFDGDTSSLDSCTRELIYEAWSGNRAFDDAYGQAWSNETCGRLSIFLDTIKRKECGYGTSSCTCTNMSFACTTECGTIPAALGDCDDLVELTLYGSTKSSLTGTIPSVLGRLSRLRVLDLGTHNELNGPVPSELGNLSELVSLDLGGTNTLVGSIPSHLGLLSKLTTLTLSGRNALTGSIPSHLGRLSSLETLDLGGGTNRLDGTIPSELGDLSKLKSINLMGNDLRGVIPSTFERLSKLEKMILSANSLTSPIFQNISSSLSRLTELRLDRNAFGGSIPSVRHLTSLQTLHLDRNHFSGTIPRDHFNESRALQYLQMNYNNFEGDVPIFANLENLIHIMLRNNKLDLVPSNAFARIGSNKSSPEDGSEVVTIDLANQRIVSFFLDLHDSAFANIGEGARIFLSGNTLEFIPSHCFRGLANTRLDLSNTKLRELQAHAFANMTNVTLDLSTNYIERIHYRAFPSFRSVDSSKVKCVDAYGWDTRCTDLARIAGPQTCANLTTCNDIETLHFDEESGENALEACCAFGGGFRTGAFFAMDEGSPVTCKLEVLDTLSNLSTAEIQCGCSDQSSYYDYDTTSCTQSCGENLEWNSVTETLRQTKYSMILAGQLHVGTCVACPLGKSSEEGTLECSDCPILFALSKHCEFPVAGILIFGSTALFVFALSYWLVWCIRVKHREAEARAKELRATQADKLLIESAWKIDWSSIELVDRLAAGGFGEVWRGIMGDTTDVAIKKMFRTENTNLDCEQEIHFLKRCRHAKLVWFMGCGKIDNDAEKNIFLVLEFMNRGDLCGLLWASKRKKTGADAPSWRTRLSLLKDSSEGMIYVHGVLQKLHRDLKSPNILLCATKSGGLIAKVADFGLAKGLKSTEENAKGLSAPARTRSSPSSSPTDSGDPTESSKTGESNGGGKNRTAAALTSFAGSLLWMAPEVYPKNGEKRLHYDNKIDVYSFGIIMWESLTLAMPWSHGGNRFQKGPINAKIMNAVEAGERLPISGSQASSAPIGFVALLNKCWDGTPSARPSFQKILFALQDMELDLATRATRVRPSHSLAFDSEDKKSHSEVAIEMRSRAL
eukprot:g4028.t1